MREGGSVEIEAERLGWTACGIVQPEEARLGVDEASDQPGAGGAVDP